MYLQKRLKGVTAFYYARDFSHNNKCSLNLNKYYNKH